MRYQISLNQPRKEKRQELKEQLPFNTTITIAGDLLILKSYNYQHDPWLLHKNRDQYEKAAFGTKSKSSLQRTRNNAMLLIESNITRFTKFITFTTTEPIYESQMWHKEWHKFRQRFKRTFGYSLKYLKVIEGQKKRKAKFNLPGEPLHAHLVVFSDKYIPQNELQTCWGLGIVHIEKVKSSDVGRYLMKYITKDNDFVSLNKKGYYSSGKLKQPHTIRTNDIIAYNSQGYNKTYSVNVPMCPHMEVQLQEIRTPTITIIDEQTGDVKTLPTKDIKSYLKSIRPLAGARLIPLVDPTELGSPPTKKSEIQANSEKTSPKFAF